MDNQAELMLLHPRSIAAVIRDGYRLYMGTFRRLFRFSWPWAVLYAIAFALMMGNFVNNVVPVLTAISTFGYDAAILNVDQSLTIWLTAGSCLFFALAAIALAAHDIEMFREHLDTGDVGHPKHWYGRWCGASLGRLLIAALWLLLITVVVIAAFVGIVHAILSLGVVGSVWKSVASVVLLLLLALIVMVFLLPFSYAFLKAILDKKWSWKPPFKGYAVGLKRVGLLFATATVVCVITSLLTLVCELPAFIIALANAEAYAGLATGDQLGLPDYIAPMTYCVFTIAGFIQAYVHLSTLFPFYYAYGSIEQQENERKQMSI